MEAQYDPPSYNERLLSHHQSGETRRTTTDLFGQKNQNQREIVSQRENRRKFDGGFWNTLQFNSEPV